MGVWVFDKEVVVASARTMHGNNGHGGGPGVAVARLCARRGGTEVGSGERKICDNGVFVWGVSLRPR